MKELTSYNRVAGYLNKVFDLLNEEFFENTLSRPTITIQSTPRAYGHFSLREDTWVSKLGGTHEINIGAGTLARPIEEVAATLRTRWYTTITLKMACRIAAVATHIITAASKHPRRLTDLQLNTLINMDGHVHHRVMLFWISY